MLMMVLVAGIFAKNNYKLTTYFAKSLIEQYGRTKAELQEGVEVMCRSAFNAIVASELTHEYFNTYDTKDISVDIDDIVYISKGFLMSQYMRATLVNKKTNETVYMLIVEKGADRDGVYEQAYYKVQQFNNVTEMNEALKSILFTEAPNHNLYDKYVASYKD